MIDPNFYLKSDERIEEVLQIQRNIIKNISNHIDEQISDTCIDESVEVVSEHLDITLSKPVMDMIFKTYTKARVEAISFGPSDTLAREFLLNAVCEFFLNCKYSEFESVVEFERFKTILKNEVEKFKL